VEEAEQEELCQAIQSLVASGMSIKEIEEFFLAGKTETKKETNRTEAWKGQRPWQGQEHGQEHGQRHLVHANKILV
jgi:hypothetical protein